MPMTKRKFSDLPIRTKLTVFGVLCSSSALFLACVSYLGFDLVAYRDALVRSISTQAEIVGYNSASAVLFQDPGAAVKTLSALRARPNIRLAGIYNAEGVSFALWQADGESPRVLPPLPEVTKKIHRWGKNQLALFHPMIFDGSRIGTVYIESDLQAWYDRMQRALWVSCVVLVLALLGAYLVSLKLGDKISRPILDLSDTAKAISEKQDYSRRVAASGKDEIGQLVETFNDMLTQVQKRGEALRQSHEALELRVRMRTMELEEANKEMEAFSYSVSHDLRAPLRHIIGFSDIVLKDSANGLTETNKRYLGLICDSAKNMGKLIDDLLSFSRMARLQIDKSSVDLSRLVKDVIEEMKPETEGRNITWKIGELPQVKADPSLIRLVLVNLLSNAVKYTRRNPQAVIEIGAISPQNGSDEFFVRDNGVGFDMRYVDKLFGVFQRLHSNEEFEGTGIGLANVRRIVLRHKGRIWAEARPNEGATFHVSLPR